MQCCCSTALLQKRLPEASNLTAPAAPAPLTLSIAPRAARRRKWEGPRDIQPSRGPYWYPMLKTALGTCRRYSIPSTVTSCTATGVAYSARGERAEMKNPSIESRRGSRKRGSAPASHVTVAPQKATVNTTFVVGKVKTVPVLLVQHLGQLPGASNRIKSNENEGIIPFT